MQLQFDARTWLSVGSTLGVYLDARCTREVANLDSEDLIAAETLRVSVERVWVKYHCHQNRENAWGFKLLATPIRWRMNNEVAIVESPFEFGWDLLQLMFEEAPSAMCEPRMLANVLRYLLYGRAPHKERASLLLLRALGEIRLDEPPFDVTMYQGLEQLIAWHDALLKQSASTPIEGTALIPHASQSILDLLIEARTRMQARNLTVWPSTLGYMSEVCELASLSKWLLRPSEHSCPRASVRLAARAINQAPEFDLRVFERRWSTELDERLIAFVNKSPHSNTLNLRATVIASLAEQARDANATLGAFSSNEVCLRLALLQRFNQLLSRHLTLVHTGTARKAHTLGARICALRGILLETKLAALEQALAATVADGDATLVVLNRFKATKLRPKAEAEHSGEGTLFVQLFDQLGTVKPRSLLRHDKAFKTSLAGESADDHGGPYREAIAAVSAELMSDALPLFIRSPNGKNSVGDGRDKFVPNPSATDPNVMEWFYFLGSLLGLALRQKETQLGLSIPSVLWKHLVASDMDANDHDAFDHMCKQSLDKLRNITDEGITDAATFESMIFETFTTQLSDGSEVALLPNGAQVEVTFDNRHDFCDSVEQARLHESQHQCDAILQGLSYMVPQRVLTLFTWQQLELLCCGSREIDLELLRQKTKYGVGVTPTQRHVRYFWQALRKFSPENRALFLRFVWGRTRLPATPAEWGDVKFTLHTRHTSNADAAYPVAHTCFFSLELPPYSSATICYERLLYAIHNCQDIDIDTTTSARENRERQMEDDSDDDAGPSDS